MIKQALEYIVGLSETQEHTIDGRIFTDKKLTEIVEPTLQTPITTGTLKSIVDYIIKNCDFATMKGQIIVHIANSSTVNVAGFACSSRNYDRDRFITAKAYAPNIQLNNYIDMESFIIQLQTCFDRQQGDWDKLAKLASNITIKDEVKSSDDGCSQQVTAKTGVARMEEITLPNPVLLAPMRTFSEVKQPLLPFVYRIDKHGNMGLFEADGGAWKLKAINLIEKYLQDALSDCEAVHILA